VKCCAGDLHGQIWGRVRAAATPRFGRKNEGKFDGATGGERKTRAGGGGGIKIAAARGLSGDELLLSSSRTVAHGQLWPRMGGGGGGGSGHW
jgi:hypothetical protein